MSTTPSATPPSTPTIHCPVNYLNESWCDIRYKSGCSSTGSISHLHHTVNPEILEKLLYEAQREGGLNSPTHPKSGNLLPYTNDTALSMTECMVDSIHHNLDTSTPMLVTFETSSGVLSPIIAKAPTSPISNKNNSLTLAVLADCSQCVSQKQQIANLLELQQSTERQLNVLRKEYEDQCLSKSPDFMSRSTRSSISSSSISEDQDTEKSIKKSQMEHIFPSLKRQNSSSATLVSLNAANVNSYASGIFNNCPMTTGSGSETADWTKYWSSRPQKQPPKEWNFVHPNSAKSKLNNMLDKEAEELEEEKGMIAKYISCDSISKILFTHMASFIVGATLMFLVLRRHLNLRSSVFMK